MISRIARKLAAVLGLVVSLALAGPAAANSYDIGTNGTPVGALVGSAPFIDYFNFQLGNSSPLWSLSGVGLSQQQVLNFPDPFPDITILPVTFDTIQMFKLTAPSTWTWLWTETPASSSVSYSGLADPGTYSLKVFGHANSSFGGAYVVAFQAAPVPEPGEWAMILAGLGIVGVMARRRSTTI
jgi:hypothetical protein